MPAASGPRSEAQYEDAGSASSNSPLTFSAAAAMPDDRNLSDRQLRPRRDGQEDHSRARPVVLQPCLSYLVDVIRRPVDAHRRFADHPDRATAAVVNLRTSSGATSRPAMAGAVAGGSGCLNDGRQCRGSTRTQPAGPHACVTPSQCLASRSLTQPVGHARQPTEAAPVILLPPVVLVFIVRPHGRPVRRRSDVRRGLPVLLCRTSRRQ